MPKDICLLQTRWLEDEWFKHWIRKKWHCCNIHNYCSKHVIVSSVEEAALTSHVKGKKHVEKSPSDQCIKPLMPPTPAPPLIILKISLSGGWSYQ